MTRVSSKVFLVSEILRLGRFEVPWHQRYYDWSEEEVDDLLSDLDNAVASDNTCYFLGSIMLVNPLSSALLEPRRINDGQQRLITLSLLIASFCRRFARRRPRDPRRKARALRALFEFPDNQPARLKDSSEYRPRIEPPRDNRSNYFQIIRGHDIGTNGPLTAAWNRIDGFVRGMKKTKREKFFDFLMEKVEISVLEIPGDVDANSVFESLNARGKPLDDVDLIRNHLYSYFSEADDSVRRDAVHENLEDSLVILRGAKKVQEYFRVYLQCRYGHLKKTRFYKQARARVEEYASRWDDPPDYVYKLVTEMGRRDSVELFRTITSSRVSPSLEKKLPSGSGKRKLAVLLRELREYTVSHPLVCALLHRFICEKDKERKRKTGRVVMRSLKNLASFVMRTAFVSEKFEPSKFEDAFANCARDIFKGSDLESLDIMAELERGDEKDIISDANFIRLMRTVEFRKDTRRPIRLLFGINAQAQRGSDALMENKCSLEHILPQSDVHWGGWSGFRGKDPGRWVYRTGNMLVVPKGENRSDAEYNGSFRAKKRAFAKSMLKMPQILAEDYDEWTPQAVEERSRLLAKQAAQVWKFLRRGVP